MSLLRKKCSLDGWSEGLMDGSGKRKMSERRDGLLKVTNKRMKKKLMKLKNRKKKKKVNK